MTLDEIAYNIKNLVEGGISGEDSNLSIRQIKHMIHYHRANLLTKYTDSGRFVSDPMFQTLTRGVNNLSGLPRILGWANNRAIRDIIVKKSNVTSTAHHVNIVSESNRQFFEESRFAPNKSQFFITTSPGGAMKIYENDGQIFVDTTYNVIITAVFENPVNAGASSSSQYPIPAELVGSLVETVLAKEFNMYLRTSADIANNSVDDKGANPAATPVSASPNANARSRRGRTR